MIQKLLDALEYGDEVAVSACFAEDGQFFDYCPCVNGKEAYIIYGRSGIEMLYRNLFAINRLIVSVPEADGDISGTFFGAYEGPYVFARVSIQETDDNGLIKRAVVTPA